MYTGGIGFVPGPLDDAVRAVFLCERRPGSVNTLEADKKRNPLFISEWHCRINVPLAVCFTHQHMQIRMYSPPLQEALQMFVATRSLQSIYSATFSFYCF